MVQIARMVLVALAVGAFGVGRARAQVDIASIDKGMPGPRTQVLVLGSVHLSQMPKDFKRESLLPVLDKLAAFKPTIITIESLSGEQCDHMARYPSIYAPSDVKQYCPSTVAAKAATGLDVPAAIAEMNSLYSLWPAQPSAAQRRHLAAVLLAAGEPASALAQWLQLPADERHAGEGLDAALVSDLSAFATKNNESYAIAAVLVARLGLQRVYPVDDHTGDNVAIDDEKAYGKAIQSAWDAAAASWKSEREREQQLSAGTDMLALYRFINEPAVRRAVMHGDFAAALRDPSPQRYGRLYVAGWEIRNLRMVSNVHAAFAEHPGAHVLAIVGASHTPWFERLLGLMPGVDIVPAEQVLK